MPKVWKVKTSTSDDLTIQLLNNRGIKIKGDIDKFLNPCLADFEKDFNLPRIALAHKRINEAISNKELIIVYGDYDADGLCGAAVLYYALTSLGAKVLPYIPHREKEGYGLSKEGLEQVKEKGGQLIITVDNGIVAQEQAKLVKKLGMELIITDHHEPQKILPQAVAIVHSTKMSGASVAWCLIRNMVSTSLALNLLDLVSIATICDLLPLIGINRALVKIGLAELNKTDKVGLQALILESGLVRGKITAYQVGHILGPRINALGRMEHSLDTLRLLCTKDTLKARSLALKLCEVNDQKKKLTIDSIINIKEIIVQDSAVLSKKIFIFASEQWIPGVIGLMAGKICEEYRVPTIVISKGEQISKGSARSISGVNIVEALRKCAHLLIDVGGHPGAAGFTIETAKISIFKKTLEDLIKYEPLELGDYLEIEAVVQAKILTKKLVSELEVFEPTGLGNPKPILASKNIQISDIRTVGNGQHLKFKVIDTKFSQSTDGIDVIAFSQGNLASILQNGQLINLAFYPEIDNFNNSNKLQLKALDIQVI